jgi:hypothetical protein
MEQLDYNLLYRWFVGLGVDEAVGVPTVFTKNRDRLLEADVARKFISAPFSFGAGAVTILPRYRSALPLRGMRRRRTGGSYHDKSP